MIKKILIVTVLGLLLAGCSQNIVDVSEDVVEGEISIDVGNPEVFSNIKATPSNFDFGDIDKTKGNLSTTIKISNTADFTLKLNRLSTSCGCTTAEMDMSDLTPGESRDMKITFDPMAHPDITGRIVRVVYLQTSDPSLPELEIEITGNVI